VENKSSVILIAYFVRIISAKIRQKSVHVCHSYSKPE